MRGTKPLAILAFCAWAGLAPAAALAQQQTPAPASDDPAVVKALKKAVQTQGDVSAATAKAVQNDPAAAKLIEQGREAGEDSPARRAAQPAAPAAPPPSGQAGKPPVPRNTKALYGDIIIHR